MRIIDNKSIDLSNYDENDLIINNANASMLVIQFDSNGGSAITICGKSLSSSIYYYLTGLDGDMQLINDVSISGIYTFNITGIDTIKIQPNGNNVSLISIKLVD